MATSLPDLRCCPAWLKAARWSGAPDSSRSLSLPSHNLRSLSSTLVQNMRPSLMQHGHSMLDLQWCIKSTSPDHSGEIVPSSLAQQPPDVPTSQTHTAKDLGCSLDATTWLSLPHWTACRLWQCPITAQHPSTHHKCFAWQHSTGRSRPKSNQKHSTVWALIGL